MKTIANFVRSATFLFGGGWAWASVTFPPLSLPSDERPLYHQVNTFVHNSRRIVPDELLLKPPYNSVMRLIRVEKGKFFGCVMFSAENPNIWLTAAHCVLDSDGKNAKLMRAIYGLNGDYAAARKFEPHVYYVNPGFADTTNISTVNAANDCAVLYISDALPADIEPFEIDPGPACNGPNQELQAIGYSEDVALGSVLLEDRSCHEYSYGRESKARWRGMNDMMYEDCNFTKTGSGSPIFCVSPDKRRYVRGIQEAEFVMVHLPYFGYQLNQHLNLQISQDTVNVATYARDCYDKVKELKTKIESRRDQ